MSNPIAADDAATIEDLRALLANALACIEELEGHVKALRILIAALESRAQCPGVTR